MSLRKQKKDQIIKERRKRLMMTTARPTDEEEDVVGEGYTYSDYSIYERCPLFRENESQPGDKESI